MDYSDTINYLYSRLPMFSRSGASAIKTGLKNTQLLCQKLEEPQNRFKSIHVGGTNGKGSTSHMLAAILQTAGYKTGLYTSPHLKDFRERIRINGLPISEQEVIEFVALIEPAIEELGPSFFEVTVAMAFNHFAKNKVDVAIIEVGLGGRLDSTNVIFPILSVITNIGWDHMNILGNTLQEIAQEKAGIIKTGVPVVIGEKIEETESVFTHAAREKNSNISFAQEIYAIEYLKTDDLEHLYLRAVKQAGEQDGRTLRLDLPGKYQMKNLATVLTSVDELRTLGFKISDQHISVALENVKKLTGLMGRWQILSRSPLIICDTGHNEDGIKEVLVNIESTPFQNLHFVLGMVKDKDISKILSLLPTSASYYFCSPKIERGKPAAELKAEASRLGLNGKAFSSVAEALIAAKEKAKKEDLIFIGGSTFVVGEIV